MEIQENGETLSIVDQEDHQEDYEEEGGMIEEMDRRGTSPSITQESLRQVQMRLGLIELCFSDIDVCEHAYSSAFSDSYCTVTGKEKLILWYAENFRSQFHEKYPERKPLLLACENEYGIQLKNREGFTRVDSSSSN